MKLSENNNKNWLLWDKLFWIYRLKARDFKLKVNGKKSRIRKILEIKHHCLLNAPMVMRNLLLLRSEGLIGLKYSKNRMIIIYKIEIIQKIVNNMNTERHSKTSIWMLLIRQIKLQLLNLLDFMTINLFFMHSQVLNL